MEKISIGRINFARLRKIKCDSLEADLYHDEMWAYKIYKDLPLGLIENKKSKIEMLYDGDSLPNVVMPVAQIRRKKQFKGYKMTYIDDNDNLIDLIEKNNDLGEFLQIMKDISLDMRAIHSDPRNIVIADFNFENILVNQNGHHFADFDSCGINGIPADTVSALFNYYLEIKETVLYNLSPLTDRFSLMLAFMCVIFDKPIDMLTMKEFDAKAEEIKSLKSIRTIVEEAKDDVPYLVDVPYLDEVILEEDIKQKRLIF